MTFAEASIIDWDTARIGGKTMEIKSVFSHYEDDLRKVESYMDGQLSSQVKVIPEIINHLIGSGGKRLRPLLLLVSSSLCDFRHDSRYAMAAVIEFIHTATLLHDDVVDQAQIRRGKVSANNVWGNAASVLVGDFLYSRSFTLMADEGNVAVIQLLSAATNAMSEGEVFQLIKCGDLEISEEDYLTIIEKKTAVLISAACAVGGLLAGVGEGKVDALKRFGAKLGAAFQITDDTLDYMADKEQFGKSIGKDLEEGKITLPLIRTLQVCSDEEREMIRKVVKKELHDTEALHGIVPIIKKYDGIEYALIKAKSIIEEAKASLDLFAKSDDKDRLLAIADYIVSRSL